MPFPGVEPTTAPMRTMQRRAFLGGVVVLGAAAFGGVALAQTAPDVAPLVPPPGADGVRQLLVHATRTAVQRLSAPDGYWNSRVARCGIPLLFSRTRANAAGPLGQDEFRHQLLHRVNILAETAVRGAGPTLEAAARRLVPADPGAILRGPPTSATTHLRAAMKSDLVNAMIAALEPALAAAPDPVIVQAVAAVAAVGTDPAPSNRDVAHAIALVADNGTWYEIGAAEAEVRRTPAAFNDPVLSAAFAGA